jgi:lipid-A-disaccharide synthase-like uncharacterized protein
MEYLELFLVFIDLYWKTLGNKGNMIYTYMYILYYIYICI